MTRTMKRATVILAALALPLASCATPTGIAGASDVSGLGAPETDRGSLSVTLDSGRQAEIEIKRYKSVRTTWTEVPSLLGNCSLKHGSYDQKAVAVHVVEVKGKVTFTGEGDSEAIDLFAHAGSPDAPDQVFRVSSCDGRDQQTFVATEDFTERLFILEFANNPGHYAVSPEKVFFSVQAPAMGKQHLTSKNCEAKGGAGSPMPDICLLGLAE